VRAVRPWAQPRTAIESKQAVAAVNGSANSSTSSSG
jgi:hypothetical protein